MTTSTSNTNILIKRSSSSATPGSLKAGELAYSYLSNTFFIGTPGADGYLEIGAWSNLSSNITSINGSTTYGSTTSIPNITVDKHGKIIDITTSTISTNLSVSGDSGTTDSINLATDTLHINGGFGIETSTDGANNVVVAINNTQVIFANTNGNQMIDGNLNISGNLLVQGTATYIDTQNLIVDEPLIFLGANNASDVVDIGFVGQYNNGMANVWTGLVRHAGSSGDKNYYLFNNYSGNPEDGNFDIAVGCSSYANLQAGQITVTYGSVLKDTGCYAVSFGYNAGCCQLANAVAIGYEAGQTQAWDAVAVGRSAGQTNQSHYAVAVGRSAGATCQGYKAVAIGRYAGETNQHYEAVAIGTQAGQNYQCDQSVAIGSFAASSCQGYKAIALGAGAGHSSQGYFSVAIGANTANVSQGHSSVAVGHAAAAFCQGNDAVAIGVGAGHYGQQNCAVAIGNRAGYGYYCCGSQGYNSIAIGAHAGYCYTATNSIILNASGCSLNSTEAGFYVNPIRANNAVGGNVTTYNTTTKEIVYTNVEINNNGIRLANGTSITDTAGSANVFIKYLQAANTATQTGNIAYYDTVTGELVYGSLAGLSPDKIQAGSYIWEVDSSNGRLYSDAGTEIADSATNTLIGQSLDLTNSNTHRIAVGYAAGASNQGCGSIAIGRCAAGSCQHYASVAIGEYAGQTNQHSNSIAVGSCAGSLCQSWASVAIGYETAASCQHQYAVAIGAHAGGHVQGYQSTAVGYYAGRYSQSCYSVAIGTYAGETCQSCSSVAIGQYAGNSHQGYKAVAVGSCAGACNQSEFAVAVGHNAGNSHQHCGAVSLGHAAGEYTQGQDGISIGRGAGRYYQQSCAVAIGRRAGYNSSCGCVGQGTGAVAIGSEAGYGYSSPQGEYAVAIGYLAGYSNSATGSIILNASGSDLSTENAGFYVSSTRYEASANATFDGIAFYNASTKEFSYSYTLDGGEF